MCPARRAYIAWPWLIQAIFLVSACSTTARAPVSSTRISGAPHPAPVTGPGRQQARYVVASGDTLYSIAWRYDLDYRDVARWNDITAPYLIYPGQTLRLKPPPRPARPSARPAPAPPERVAPTRRRPESTSAGTARLSWHWPTTGKIVNSDTLIAKKGINISGHLGQPIVAAAPGAVVYSGSGLLGYGRLIIIKHNDSYLSAYAHNQKILVHEGERVSAGQQIATMGLGNKGRPVLHFEIRKDGKPVNPLGKLPKRPS
jgi:lipoprotein NlpD